MSDETAIRQDVVEKEVQPEREVLEEKPQLARDSVIDELAKKRQEEIQEELGEKEKADEAPTESRVTGADPEMVELKVNGETIHRSQEEVDQEGGVAALQKKIAGEQRLEQAAHERKRLDAVRQAQTLRAQELEQREDELRQRSDELEQLAKDKANDVTDDEVAIARNFVDGVFSGEEGEATNAVVKVFKALKAKPEVPPIDTDQIAETVHRQINFTMSKSEGNQIFQDKYAHLREDSRLFDMTQEETKRLLAEEPGVEPKEIILMAAENVDKWVKSLGVDSFTVPDDLSQRQEKKRRIDNIQTANTRAASGLKTKTRQEIFEELKSCRSQ